MDYHKKKIPIGIDRFKKLREEDFYYIDKSGMVRDLLYSWGEVNLFTRPRRFGKSLNLDMLKTFFEVGADPSYFEGLEIMQETGLCEKYMGKFPVISITLKDVEGLTCESAVKAMGGIIRKEARRLQFLLDSDKLSDWDKDYMKSFFSLSMDAELQRESLAVFSELLYKHFQQKVILLIDEYDVPLDKAWQHGYYNEMVSHIRSLFSNALKTNDYLHAAVITGCLRIAKESIFTGLNNLNVNTVADTGFAQYFGFTDNEVRNMLHYYELDEFYESIKAWYDGYHFGQLEIYCPWDVINYCYKLLENRNRRPEAFWANSSSNYIIQDILSHASETAKEQIERLISGEVIEQRIIPELTYTDMSNEDTTIRETYLWSVLYSTGYLTEAPGETGSGLHRLVIPNREILQIYRDKIQSWYNINVRRDTQKWQAFCDAVKTGSADKIQELFNYYLRRTISIRDTFVKKEMKENFYHGMLLGILQCDGSWVIKSNQESGLGYCDILLLVPGDKIGCAIELKYAENGAFDAACAEALTQIDSKKYTDYLQQEGMETIYTYAVACYKKSCRVVCRT
ncbi:MAG: ATP-binding protein [Lachnospiraceae bacterium]|nr:ATP-binding protein [Lachnospiraceae bacterium]